YATLVLIGMGVAGALYTVASAPTRVAGRLGLRGLKRTRMLAKSEMWQSLEPFVRWLGVRVSGIISEEMRAKIDEEIALAGDYMGLTADEYVALSIMTCVAGLIGGYILGQVVGFGSVATIPLGLLGAAYVYMNVSGVAQDRLKEIG